MFSNGSYTYFSGLIALIFDLNVIFSTFSFFILNMPASYIMDKHGLWVCGILANVLLLIGLWIRLIAGNSGDGYIWLLVGQLFGSSGQVFLMNAPAKVAAVWFPDK